MTTLGTFAVHCPICRRLLAVPITSAEPATDAGPHAILRFMADLAYLEAHWLTHGPHGGEPLPAAA